MTITPTFIARSEALSFFVIASDSEAISLKIFVVLVITKRDCHGFPMGSLAVT